MEEEARELLEYGKITPSSGVTVEVKPFPAQLFQRIQEKAQERFPDPVPPKKTIKVVDGTETIDDLDDETYVAEKETNERERNRWASERVLGYTLRFCVELDITEHEETIQALEEILYPFPEDGPARKLEFLQSHVFRSRDDYTLLTVETLRQMMITNPEVARRLEFFRREMEGVATTEPPPAASSSDEIERVDVSSEGS